MGRDLTEGQEVKWAEHSGPDLLEGTIELLGGQDTSAENLLFYLIAWGRCAPQRVRDPPWGIFRTHASGAGRSRDLRAPLTFFSRPFSYFHHWEVIRWCLASFDTL